MPEYPPYFAIVARNQAEAGEMAIGLEKNAPHGAHMRSYTLNRGSTGTGATWAENANIFHADHVALFDAVWVDERVLLPSTLWSRDFLLRLARMLRPQGRLWLKVAPKPRNACTVDAGLTDSWLRQPIEIQDDGYRCYGPQRAGTGNGSLIGWYMDHYAGVLFDLARPFGYDEFSALLEDTLTREFLQGIYRRDELSQLQLSSGLSVEQDDLDGLMIEYASSMAYLFQGVSYKAAVMTQIVRELMPGEQKIRQIDIGGANGALAGEMLLQDKIDVVYARTHELLIRYVPAARSIYLAHREAFKDRFQFSIGSMTDFDFDDDFNLLSFIGCLYLSGPDHQADVVARGFEKLQKGGLLIIHENLKDNRQSTSHEHMFEEKRLREILSRHGKVRYFHGTTGREISAEQVAGKTVFWVVQKAA